MKPFKLDQHHKIKSGFTVPENYFENFHASLLQQIEPEPKVIRLTSNRNDWYAAAAVFVMALTIPAINSITSNFGQTDVAALDNYFTYTDISDDQIVELLEKEDIDKIKIDFQLEDAAIEDALQTGNIENYILD